MTVWSCQGHTVQQRQGFARDVGLCGGAGAALPGKGGPSLARAWRKLQLSLLRQEGSQSHGHLENIRRAASGGWCCAPRASPQPSSEPATIHHGFVLPEPALFAWKLELAWGPEARVDQLHIYVPPWEPDSQRDRPPVCCQGLLCFAVCFVVERAGFGFSMFLFLPCSTFMYAARNPPCLPADSCTGRLRGCL